MTKVKGKMACYGWQSRTEQSRAKLLSELCWMLTELRSVPPPEGAGISNLDGGPFYDYRLPSKLL
jgi:hypothetical protein